MHTVVQDWKLLLLTGAGSGQRGRSDIVRVRASDAMTPVVGCDLVKLDFVDAKVFGVRMCGKW